MSKRLSRVLLLVGCAAAGAAYLLLFVLSDMFAVPQRQLTPDRAASPPGIRIYLEPLSLDPIRDAMQLRISAQPAIRSSGSPPVFDHGLVLRLIHDGVSERIDLPAGQSIVTTTTELDLGGGDVSHYPFDGFRSGLSIICLDQRTVRAIAITTWERLIGFRLRTRIEPPEYPGGVTVSIVARRTLAFRFFAVTIYGGMVVLAAAVLTIATLVFLGRRRPETTFLGALAAIVFALPALRNSLPGGPPLGEFADMFIFLWSELAAVAAFAMVTVMWALRGPPA